MEQKVLNKRLIFKKIMPFFILPFLLPLSKATAETSLALAGSQNKKENSYFWEEGPSGYQELDKWSFPRMNGHQEWTINTDPEKIYKDQINFNSSVAPEPISSALFLLGGLIFALHHNLRRKKTA